jgi:uncharacterized membrane protein YbhN (UPF0104 family)
MEFEHRSRIVLILLVVTGVSVYLWETVDLDETTEVLLSASLPLYAGAVATFYATVPFRTKRWQVLLDAVQARTPFGWMNGIVFLSLFFNTILPAKSGDIYRGYKASRESGVDTSTILGTIATERAVDVLVLMSALAVISIQSIYMMVPDDWREFALVTVGFILFSILCYILARRYDLESVLRDQMRGFWYGLRCITSPWTLLSFLSLTGLVWSFNVARIALLAAAVNIDIGVTEVILIAVIVTLLSGLPYTPAGIGVVEGITTTALVSIGVSSSTGLALVLLDRSITVVSVLATGSGYLLYKTGSLRPIHTATNLDQKSQETER